MKEQDELLAIYSFLWDKWLPDLYRFAMFLLEEEEQAALYLEQVFIGCWRSGIFHRRIRRCCREEAVRLLFYQELWRRWSDFFGTDGKRLAELYLIHTQNFRESQVRKIIRR